MNAENQKQFVGLTATEDCFFQPHNAGNPWKAKTFFKLDDILNSKTNVLNTEHYKITISEKTPVSLKGNIVYNYQGLVLASGDFSLDTKNSRHSSCERNVAYNTYMCLTLELTTEQ